MILHSLDFEPESHTYYNYGLEPGLQMIHYYRCRINDRFGLSSWSTEGWCDLNQLAVL